MSDSHYYPDDPDVEQQQRLVDSDDPDHDGRTPLDKTIDRIGMGSYQWALLSLCGFGWMADNMWIQAMAIILPRVQQHYSVPDSYIGSLSSAMFAGMMFGAVGWGTCSDILGRSAAFNATLFFTAVFGFFASFANSFGMLCFALFLLGSAVGGSMPTDGTLLLEHMPKEKQYLVTALSVFFSFGSVLSAFVALLVLPGNSCSNSSTGLIDGPGLAAACDVETQNRGWKYLLMTLATITLSMFLARIVFFRLHESPRYLVHAGRPQEAVKSLQMISKFNGSDLEIELEDVADHHPPVTSPPSTAPVDIPKRVDETTVFDAGDVDGAVSAGSPADSNTSSEGGKSLRPPLVTQYDATGQTPTNLEGHSFKSPIPDSYPPPAKMTLTSSSVTVTNPESSISEDKQSTPSRPSSPTSQRLLNSQLHRHSTHYSIDDDLRRVSSRQSMASRRSSVYEYERKCRLLPRWVRKPLAAWWDRMSMVLEPEWFRTTILVWAAWFSMSLAFTMFNVFLPKLLEIGAGSGSDAIVSVAEAKTLEQNLWDVMIFTIGGTPGAILGAYLIESSLGRRWSLAASTFTTALFCVLFALVESTWAVRISTVGISLSATTMWAVLYGWTPEIFGTKVRGSACGIASALSRIGGMIAPLLGGTLLMISRAVPVYTSVVVFALAGICVLMLKEGAGDSPGKGRARAIVH